MTLPEETPTSGSTLRRAFLTIERLQRQVEENERARSEPVAVIGLGCRLPGGVVDADTYWNLLSSGTDAVTDIPADRWDAKAFYSAEAQSPGKMSTRWGGFLDRIDEFDHEFFGISRREAVAMDPQQRLTLEVAWEALEDAGRAPTALAGSRTGVFMGVCSYDFAAQNFQHPLDLTAYASTGTSHSVVTGRLSYVLDLRGPSVAVDSACSSSLVSVHLAMQSLRSGECDLALGGGVNAVVSPLPSIAFSQFPGMVSPDGRCKTFDAAANGYVRSEGCGIVVLKRLSDAVRDGDRVLAVLRGGAVNQDGRSSGVTAPNGLAQRDVLRRALESSGIEPQQVGYIEAHGTGTRLGDPIEVEALAEVYGRETGTPVYLGSSKTNIGHAEAAAGIAGLIKAVLAVDRAAIPPNVHFDQLNPYISFEGTTFAVPTGLVPWPDAGDQRVAGVSSFGFSGTNAHLIVSSAPTRNEPAEDGRRPLSVLALSAKSEPALVELARRYGDRLSTTTTPLADLCYSANTGRSPFRHRLAAVGASRQQIADQLADFVDGLPGDEPVTGQGKDADVVFLFTGQGPQRVGMARALYEAQPTFRAILDHCDDVLRPLLEMPLLSVLHPADPGSSPINDTTYAQPALFAVEYATAQLWRSWGVEPLAVLGHSFGEYVAACVAGAMSLEDGLALVAERGRLMQALAATGAMAAVFAAEEVVAEAIAEHLDQVSIAAVNGPANTAISGDRDVVAEICRRFAVSGVKTRELHISTSSHSPLIEPILPGLRKAAQAVRFQPPRIPLVSNLTGELWPWDTAPDADYWCRHARQPVRFATGIDTLGGLGYRNFLEVGPAPTLLGLIGDGAPADDAGLLLPSMRPKYDDWAVMLSTVAQLHAHGADIDWHGFDRDYTRTSVPVPVYPFERTNCRPEPRGVAAHRPGPVNGSSARPATEEPEPEVDELLYELAWRPAEAAGGTPEAGAAWLGRADRTGVGDQLGAQLRAAGIRCVRARPGTERHYDGGAEAVVRLDGADDLERLVEDLAAGARLEVVHLWGLDHPGSPEDSVEQLLQAQQDGCMSAVRVVQALAGTGGERAARLWLVTRGAVQPTGPGRTPLALGQSTLWGLGRSLQQEHSGFWGGLLDLDPDADAGAAAAALHAEIEHHDQEDQVALRDGRRYVARLVGASVPEATRGTGWRPDASYLITGGLGGLGLAVARSMVAAGARRLVLVGRTPIPPRAEWAQLAVDDPAASRVAAVRELESLGASVLLESVDVSDLDRMRAFMERFDQEGWPPIRGVVHSAGVGEVAPLAGLRPVELERHLRPKAGGAWVLHRLFGGRELDFFVLFSSASSVLSSPFVGSYAAANAFLDALARLRRVDGQPGMSIDWGVWEQTGLADRGAEATPGRSDGMGTLSPEQALRAFHRLLPLDTPQVAVLPVDWSTWGRRYQEVSGSLVLAELVDGRVPRRRHTAGRPSLLPTRADLLAFPAGERTGVLTGQLTLSVTATLGAPSSAVSPDQPLLDLGMDSLMAVELRNEVERQLGLTLPVSVLLEGASVRSLAERLAADLASGGAAGSGPTGDGSAIARVERFEDVASRLLEELDDLSEEQAHSVLSREGRP